MSEKPFNAFEGISVRSGASKLPPEPGKQSAPPPTAKSMSATKPHRQMASPEPAEKPRSLAEGPLAIIATVIYATPILYVAQGILLWSNRRAIKSRWPDGFYGNSTMPEEITKLLRHDVAMLTIGFIWCLLNIRMMVLKRRFFPSVYRIYCWTGIISACYGLYYAFQINGLQSDHKFSLCISTAVSIILSGVMLVYFSNARQLKLVFVTRGFL